MKFIKINNLIGSNMYKLLILDTPDSYLVSYRNRITKRKKFHKSKIKLNLKKMNYNEILHKSSVSCRDDDHCDSISKLMIFTTPK